jgi:hypothetical protein
MAHGLSPAIGGERQIRENAPCIASSASGWFPVIVISKPNQSLSREVKHLGQRRLRLLRQASDAVPKTCLKVSGCVGAHGITKSRSSVRVCLPDLEILTENDIFRGLRMTSADIKQRFSRRLSLHSSFEFKGFCSV